jgi:rhamnosyltransferase
MSFDAPIGTIHFPGSAGVCAVIVTYNIGGAIHRCVDSIRGQVGHVVIVDNASDERTRQELQRTDSTDSVTIILNQKNEGIARAMNQGVEWARAKGFRWVLTLDHDSKATPGMVDKLLQAYQALSKRGRPDIGIIGTNPFDENGQVYLRGCRPGDFGGECVEHASLISSGSLIECRAFDAVGLFDEALFLYYVDDDFCLRLRRSGFRHYLCPEAVLLHRESAKESRRFLWRQVFYDRYGHRARYYLARNAFYLIKKHHLGWAASWPLIDRLVRDHLKLFVYDHERFSKTWYSVRGLVDAMRGRFGRLD